VVHLAGGAADEGELAHLRRRRDLQRPLGRGPEAVEVAAREAALRRRLRRLALLEGADPKLLTNNSLISTSFVFSF